MTATATFNTGYLDKALHSLDEVLEAAASELAEVDFDTLVGTGFSGALVVPALALRMGKQFILVRKDNDGSHHSGRVIGTLGQRWVFIDDIIASGRTRDRVVTAINDSASFPGYGKTPIATQHVATYLYGWNDPDSRLLPPMGGAF